MEVVAGTGVTIHLLLSAWFPIAATGGADVVWVTTPMPHAIQGWGSEGDGTMIEIEMTYAGLAFLSAMVVTGAATVTYYFILGVVTVSERLPAVIHAWRVAGRRN
jgi:hypothetical protein